MLCIIVGPMTDPEASHKSNLKLEIISLGILPDKRAMFQICQNLQ